MLGCINGADDIEAVVSRDIEILQHMLKRGLRIKILARIRIEREEILLGPSMNGGVRLKPDRNTGDPGVFALAPAEQLLHGRHSTCLDALFSQ